MSQYRLTPPREVFPSCLRASLAVRRRNVTCWIVASSSSYKIYHPVIDCSALQPIHRHTCTCIRYCAIVTWPSRSPMTACPPAIGLSVWIQARGVERWVVGDDWPGGPLVHWTHLTARPVVQQLVCGLKDDVDTPRTPDDVTHDVISPISRLALSRRITPFIRNMQRTTVMLATVVTALRSQQHSGRTNSG